MRTRSKRQGRNKKTVGAEQVTPGKEHDKESEHPPRAIISGINCWCRFDEETDITELIENPRNPNKHPDKQIALLAKIISLQGWRQPVTVSKRSGLIVKGHGRLAAAKMLNVEFVPVEYQDYENEAQELADLMADNRIAELAEPDECIIAELLSDDIFSDFDLDLTGFDDINKVGEDAEDLPCKASLADRFMVPPFSVLNAREGWWQDRKRAWISLGINSEMGRDDNIMGAQKLKKGSKSGYDSIAVKTSVFDPVLCELAYNWFSPLGGTVLDPFAGGSVRGIVASKLGRKYLGGELRQCQVDANILQSKQILQDNMPEWRCADSRYIGNTYQGKSADFLFSCPPYADLEVYSDDPSDLSTLGYTDFVSAYRDIITESCKLLNNDRFACFVVGEVRDKSGNYHNFVGDTISAFIDAGLNYYNEMVIVTQAGTVAMTAARPFEISRKVGKTHQNVLVFVKGDGKKAAKACGNIDFNIEV